jgi:hypothetical protein
MEDSSLPMSRVICCEVERLRPVAIKRFHDWAFMLETLFLFLSSCSSVSQCYVCGGGQGLLWVQGNKKIPGLGTYGNEICLSFLLTCL